MSTYVENSVIVELHNLVLTEREDDRFGRVVKTRSLDEQDLINIAAARGTELSPSTLKASFDIITKVALEQILNGATVRFGLSHFSLRVSGVFIGDQARWDPSIHSLNVSSIPIGGFREAVKSISVEVRGLAATNISIATLHDISSGEDNKRLTPGNVVILSGNKIRIVGDAQTVGISLINQATHEVIPVPMNTIFINKPSRVGFMVPSTLPSGDYKLRLTTQYTTAKNMLKEARTLLFEYNLKVV